MSTPISYMAPSGPPPARAKPIFFFGKAARLCRLAFGNAAPGFSDSVPFWLGKTRDDRGGTRGNRCDERLGRGDTRVGRGDARVGRGKMRVGGGNTTGLPIC